MTALPAFPLHEIKLDRRNWQTQTYTLTLSRANPYSCVTKRIPHNNERLKVSYSYEINPLRR